MSVNLEWGKKLIPEILNDRSEDVTVVCESGINGGADLRSMRAVGFGAFLIGEYLVRKEDPTQAFLELVSE